MGTKNNKKWFLLGSKNGTSQNTEYEAQKICTIISKWKQIFLNPNFCPFSLLIYNKEADKNFSYSDTFSEIFCWKKYYPQGGAQMITDEELWSMWFICGLVAVLICVAIVVVKKRRWKKVFFIAWPIIFMLGLIGLLGVLHELCDIHKIQSDR